MLTSKVKKKSHRLAHLGHTYVLDCVDSGHKLFTSPMMFTLNPLNSAGSAVSSCHKARKSTKQLSSVACTNKISTESNATPHLFLELLRHAHERVNLGLDLGRRVDQIHVLVLKRLDLSSALVHVLRQHLQAGDVAVQVPL